MCLIKKKIDNYDNEKKLSFLKKQKLIFDEFYDKNRRQKI